MKLYFFIKVQHTGDTDLGQADMHVPGLNDRGIFFVLSDVNHTKINLELK